MPVKKGDKIKVEYVGTLEDGTVFDDSKKHEKPLEFEVGAGQIIKGFDEAVIGMEKEEEKEITIPPEKAYGDHNPDLIKKIPIKPGMDNDEIEPGKIIVLSMQNGQKIPAKVVEKSDKDMTLDLNPPLAGKTLKFKIKILDISS